jgi:hypothetical protein
MWEISRSCGKEGFVAFLGFGTNVRTINSFVERVAPDTDGPGRPQKRRRNSRPLAEWNPRVNPRSGAPPP